jgi:hypothetical protein
MGKGGKESINRGKERERQWEEENRAKEEKIRKGDSEMVIRAESKCE